jgi:hypothetical protein
MTDHNLENELLSLIQEIEALDQSAREKYGIGNKFKFVSNEIEAIKSQLSNQLSLKGSVVQQKNLDMIAADEVLVYVYLYNTNGLSIPTWVNFLTPKLFFEYSVNRPAYTDINSVRALLRSKPNKVQHAYFSVAVQSANIFDDAVIKDALENPLIRVKEGAYQLDKLIRFYHADIEYRLHLDNILKPIESPENN